MVSLIPLLTELLSSQLEKKHNKGRKQGSKDKTSFKRKSIISASLTLRAVAKWKRSAHFPNLPSLHFKSTFIQLINYMVATKLNVWPRGTHSESIIKPTAPMMQLFLTQLKVCMSKQTFKWPSKFMPAVPEQGKVVVRRHLQVGIAPTCWDITQRWNLNSRTKFILKQSFVPGCYTDLGDNLDQPSTASLVSENFRNWKFSCSDGT